MPITEVLLYAAPALVLASILISIYALRLARSAAKQQEYKADTFRLSLEEQIVRLSQQLAYNSARFESINHLLLDAQKSNPSAGFEQRGSRVDFFGQMGIDPKTPIDDRLIFVLTPFNPDFNQSYAIIKRTVQELGFNCQRGDEEMVSSNILFHILNRLVRARFVIADITGRNPNVFYELGIAHALGKPVLLLSRNPNDLAFDISATRVLIYHDSDHLNSSLRNWLVHSLAIVR